MRSIKRCLNKQLAEICQHSMQLEELSCKVNRLLPADLAASCQVGSFSKGCLTLTTSHAAFASQLRYVIPELRDKLRKEAGMYQLSSVKIKIVIPPAECKKNKASAAPGISDKAKATIVSESQKCSYQPLQKALLNLGH